MQHPPVRSFGGILSAVIEALAVRRCGTMNITGLAVFLLLSAPLSAQESVEQSKELTPATISATTDTTEVSSSSNAVKEQVASDNRNLDGGYEMLLRYVLPAVIGFFSVVLGVMFTRRNLISDHWLRTNALEIDYIQKRLDNVWGPYLLLSDSNHLLAQDLRSRQPKPELYRMLPSLFDEEWLGSLSPGDRQLVRDVCENGERLATLIVENSGMVDFKLLPFLSRAIVHWRVLKLAAEGKLGSDSMVFLRYVYPRALDEAVQREVLRLNERLTLLRSTPSKYHGPMKPLNLKGLQLDEWPDPARPKFVEGTGLVLDPVKGKSLWHSLNENE